MFPKSLETGTTLPVEYERYYRVELPLLIGEKAPPIDVQSFNLHTDQTDGLINALVTLMRSQNGNSILEVLELQVTSYVYTIFIDNTSVVTSNLHETTFFDPPF